MQLVGAKDYFIKAPFYLEGILEGILGGIFSFILLFIIYQIMSLSVMSFNFPTLLILIFAVLFGAFLGGIGANLALNRILK